jgi:hypothetical protein
MSASLHNYRNRRKNPKVIPFPLVQQRRLVVRLAAQMAAEVPARADKLLRAEVLRRINALHRHGLSDFIVERQVRAFESAIRVELWRVVLLPPAPDGAA